MKSRPVSQVVRVQAKQPKGCKRCQEPIPPGTFTSYCSWECLSKGKRKP